MRRTDREIKDFSQIVDIMKRCKVCNLCFNDEYPYVVPLNFGMKVDNGEVILYFHGADNGRKHDLIKRNNKVGFVMENMLSVVTSEIVCNSFTNFESVMGYGRLEYVNGEEKKEALRFIMKQYTEPNGENFKFESEIIKRTCVMKLKVEGLSAKKLIKK